MADDTVDQFVVDPTTGIGSDETVPNAVDEFVIDPETDTGSDVYVAGDDATDSVAADAASDTDATANVTDLQDQAQQAVSDGDYATAADYQAQAETAAAAGGDTGDLTGPDSGELGTAATDQQTAATDQAQEATDAAAGDYSAATDDAAAASAAAAGADASGGGLTNDGSADTEQLDESWANWDQETADQDSTTAQSYADAGFTDDAQMYAGDAAGEEQTAAGLGSEGTYDTAGADPVPDDTAVAEEAPVEEAAPVDDSVPTGDDASAAS
jgi:hypothetical protein